MPSGIMPPGMKEPLFIEEVAGHQTRYKKLIRFTSSSTKAAAIMLVAAVVALVIANSDLYPAFSAIVHTELGFVIGDTEMTMSLGHVVNDIFMAIFFLMIGLEIKYEMTAGALTNVRQAALPVIAACGGVAVPIIIYLFFNASNPATAHGWGIPTATDIAFALGIMALLGNRVPIGVLVFLSTLAVADDIIAIVIIAVFYGASPSLLWMVFALAVFGVLLVLNRSHVYSLVPYLLIGAVLWYCVYMSGVHSTIAGVLLAFTIPVGSRVNLKGFFTWSDKKVEKARKEYTSDVPLMGQRGYIEAVADLSTIARQAVPPATRLEHMLSPWVNFAILPLFALTNADVRLVGTDPGMLFSDPALYGVFSGLLLGKPLGIMLFSLVAVKLKIAPLPANVNWAHMLGAGILGGVGFTMAIFVANLAFDDPAIIIDAKVAILASSFVAGILGFLVLWTQARKAEKQGLVYVSAGDEGAAQGTKGESFHEGQEFLSVIDSPLISSEVKAAQDEHGFVELVVDLGEDNRFGHDKEEDEDSEPWDR